MNDFKPLDEFTISDLETLRAVADPLRMQIFEALLEEPANVKQVAERLGLAPSRLYYHFQALEKLGLIRVTETRMVNNMAEKYYRAIALGLNISPDLFNFNSAVDRETLTSYLTNSIDVTREDLTRSIQARLIQLDQGAPEKPRNVMINRTLSTIPDERAEEFQQRLKELIQEFTDGDQPLKEGEEDSDRHLYGLLVALYPSFYYKEGGG